MAYTTINKPSDYFNTVLWTGNGSTQSITGVGFQPDWVWIKSRSGVYYHQAYDAVRGSTKKLLIDASAESTDATGLTSFDSDGFSLGSNIGVNENTSTHVAWNWLANGAGSSNTDGSITSTVSANTTSGFSIVTYTGTGANATVGHGLGVAPEMVIVKSRTNAYWWFVYHKDLGVTGKLNLNTTGYNNDLQSYYWNSTAPSSSVFSLGTETGVNASGDNFVAYCFAPIKGFSKFGSYTGNGSSDGTFVFTGFKPAFIMVKNSTTTGPSWVILDNKRNTYNPESNYLQPNTNDAEASSAYADFLSNGFKFRSADNWVNGSGATYIYMAFAEFPIVSSSGVPCTAR